jgi:plasmid stabilization system protein ParE
MRFATEFSADAERDFALVFDHLLESYISLGEGTDNALDHAARRVMEIRKAADQLATLPGRGTARDDILPELRFIEVKRAIYWFDVDEAARTVRILAVFLGGQDHIRHMLVRLLGRDGA